MQVKWRENKDECPWGRTDHRWGWQLTALGRHRLLFVLMNIDQLQDMFKWVTVHAQPWKRWDLVASLLRSFSLLAHGLALHCTRSGFVCLFVLVEESSPLHSIVVLCMGHDWGVLQKCSFALPPGLLLHASVIGFFFREEKSIVLAWWPK
jgi:hypothetical protein